MIPPHDASGKTEPRAAALAYRAAGLSVIPIGRDGSKRPDGRLLPEEWDEAEGRYKRVWGPFEKRLPTEAEVIAWFDRAEPPGIALIGGRVSGGLFQIDIDDGSLFPAYRELVELEAPGLIERLSIATTPREETGYHLRGRCPDAAKLDTGKLAEEPVPDPLPGKPKRRTLFEAKNEGGYCLAPGSPGACHPTGGLYQHYSGPKITQVGLVMPQEYDLLIRVAVSFDRMPVEEERYSSTPRPSGSGLSPGDDYCQRGPDWAEILDGWELARQSGQVRYWRRPGKSISWSATTGVCANGKGHELLAVFSSNADPFPGPASGRKCSTHTKFAAYTLLRHGGDFSAAAKDLAEQGYGTPRARSASPSVNGHPVQSYTKSFALGGLELRPGRPNRAAGGKLTMPVRVLRPDASATELLLSNSPTGLRDAARALRQLANGESSDQVETTLASLFGWAGPIADEPKQTGDGDGLAARALVSRWVQAELRLTYRPAKGGLWSETLAREMTRAELLAFTPDDLMDQLPPGTSRWAAEELLKGVWANLTRHLPTATEATQDPDSAAAKRLRTAMVRLWHSMKTFQVAKVAGESVAARASLLSRVQSQRRARQESTRRQRWIPIQDGFAAWWRPSTCADGQLSIALGLRYELAGQMGVELPEVYDQAR